MKRLTAFLLCAALALSVCAGGALALAVPEEVSEFCSQEEWEVLAETNRERLREGLEPYSTFPHLQTVARLRSSELEILFDHVRPDQSSWSTALTGEGLGYTVAGENIAARYTGARQVVDAWMLSPNHRENILDTSFAHMGAGLAVGEEHDAFWTQTFLYKGCPTPEPVLSREQVSCPFDTPLEELGIYLVAVCPFHGSCCLPLLEEMCSGYDSRQPGEQTVMVSCYGRTLQLQVEVAAPPLDTSSADEWAVGHLLRADQLELLSLRNRGEFAADVTRLQFADLAVRLAEKLTGGEIEPAEEGSFPDSDDEAVRKAFASGIASGYPDGTFRPDAAITREELCVMLHNVVRYAEGQLGRTLLPQEEPVLSQLFPDAGSVGDWAAGSVALMTGTGVMTGRDGWIAPQESGALEEAVTLAVKLYYVLTAPQEGEG